MEKKLIELGLKVEAVRTFYNHKQHIPTIAFECFFTPEIKFSKWITILNDEELPFRLWFLNKMLDYASILPAERRYDEAHYIKQIETEYLKIHSLLFPKQEKQRAWFQKLTQPIISKFVGKMPRIKDFIKNIQPRKRLLQTRTKN